MTEASYQDHIETAVTGGKVRGRRIDDVATFLGIPYGANTAGPNRYRSPQPVKPWSGVRESFEVGHVCPQVPLADSLPLRDDIAAALNMEAVVSDGRADRDNMGEDCLNLNLWAPSSAGADTKLPVLVWLHGGGLTSGGGNLARTSGHNLASRGDVVVVAVNHRLGAFGYLHLGGLSRDPSVSTAGNNGMLDIVQALEWVRDNIAQFGGDPGRVTIFGYSGGGFKVCALMGMPAANGLFHRAIVQSGFSEGADAASSTAVARRLLDLLAIEPDDIDALRALPAEQIVRVQQEMGGVYAGFANVIDGSIMPAPVSESIRAGVTGQVPLIAGYTREEASVFVAHSPGYGELTWEHLPAALQQACGDRAGQAIEVYRKARPDASPTRIMVGILSDQLFGAPGRSILEAHAASPTRRSWGYVSTWSSSVLPDIYAGHGVEETLYFGNAAVVPATRDAVDGADLGAKLSETWVTFARNGNPNGTVLPHWPQYDMIDHATMIIDTSCVVNNDPFGEERAFWSARDNLVIAE